MRDNGYNGLQGEEGGILSTLSMNRKESPFELAMINSDNKKDSFSVMKILNSLDTVLWTVKY